jgi:hypothetical protein
LNSSKREPSTMRAITSRTSYGCRVSALTMPYSSPGRTSAARARHVAGQLLGVCSVDDDRPRQMQRVLVVFGEVVGDAGMRVWTSAPPSLSAVTSSPVAAFTSGGPPRKIVPVPLTMMVSSDMAGTYGAARRARAHDDGDLRNPLGRHPRLIEEDAPEVLAIGEDLGLEAAGNAPPESTEIARTAAGSGARSACARTCFFTVMG